MITSYPKYEKKFLFKSHYIRANEYQFPIALKYQDLWFPLIKNNIIIQYNIIYFEDWKEIKNQVCSNYEKWLKKIKTIENSYEEISKLPEFNKFIKSDYFYRESETIIRKNLIKGLIEFKKKIKEFEDDSKSEDITSVDWPIILFIIIIMFYFSYMKAFPKILEKN